MSITIFGLAIAAIATILLLRASADAMFVLLILCGLMGGSAAISLPALGGSSVPPVTFCLGFLALRLLLPGSGYGRFVLEGVYANLFLLIFVGYCVTIAMLGPHLFAPAIKVVPMRSTDAKIWATYPLAFSAQNITASFYLAATFCCAVGSYVACRAPGGGRSLVTAAITLAIIHMALGILSVASAGTAFAGVLDVFRNASYAQLDQSVDGFVRMTGIMSEPSAFAGYGFVWGVFLIECWYRDVRPRVTGPVGLAMIFVLLASTASTAYISVGAYAALIVLRMVLALDGVRQDKVLVLLTVVGAVTTLTLSALLVVPSLAARLLAVLAELTVNKSNSLSGIQRAFWARQGLAAFDASFGLGIGPGSFRSSSIMTAILGATGLIGAASFACYLVTVLKPLRTSSYHRVFTMQGAIGSAASWAALCLLIPAGIASPTADPGTDFAILAGSSLALRLRRRAAPASPTADVSFPQEQPPSLVPVGWSPASIPAIAARETVDRRLWSGLLEDGLGNAEV